MLSLPRKYHTHKRLKESLAALAEEFPDITELTSIGKSVEVKQSPPLQYSTDQALQGRDLLVLRLTAGAKEPRPLLRPQVSATD